MLRLIIDCLVVVEEEGFFLLAEVFVDLRGFYLLLGGEIRDERDEDGRGFCCFKLDCLELGCFDLDRGLVVDKGVSVCVRADPAKGKSSFCPKCSTAFCFKYSNSLSIDAF